MNREDINSTTPFHQLQSESDEVLLDQYILASCQRSFELLHQRHDQPLRTYLARKLRGDECLAEDLAQQTWLRVHEAHHTFKPGSKVRPWLYSIAANAAIDYFRVQCKVQTCSLHGLKTESFDDEDGDTYQPEDSRHELPPHVAEMRELCEQLPPGDREAVELVYVQGMTFAEAAIVLGIPQGTAKTRLVRSIRWLRDHMLNDNEVRRSA